MSYTESLSMGALLSWRTPRRSPHPLNDDTTPPCFSNFGEAPPASRVSRLREWRAARRRSTESTAGTTTSWRLPRLSSSTEPRRVSTVSVMAGCFGLASAQPPRHETSAVTTAHVDASAKGLL